ncbi:MAG: DNA mismatch repair endonuclease MutL [Planctomycetia bacterium]
MLAMGRIHTLPMSVVNRIAAGEVVERPASIVKELLENALDARPTRIDVALDQGGVTLVRVVDDGCGIEPDDLPLAVSPHATSKLRSAEDLERIGTLGFRGEALASIAEVSRLVIRSRPPDGSGASLEVDNGRTGEVVPEGCAVGTSVEVRQVFGNVPARRAFLRAPQTEWSHASEAFVRTALAHPDVAFTLSHNGRLVHDLPVASSWRERIGGLFGSRLAERLIDVSAEDGDIRVNGLVGRPEDDQASGRLQHLFVVGRPFRDRSILHAVQEAYRGLLLTGRQPIVFLQFDLPPEFVDVNVHPAKMEVRFRDPQRLYRLVLSSLRSKFLESDMGTSLRPPAATVAAAASPPWAAPATTAVPPALFVNASFPMPAAPRAASAMTTAASVAAGPSAPSAEAGPPGAGSDRGSDRGSVAPPIDPDERAVQMHNRYLVVEREDGIEVIDQHALHERVLFERLKASVNEGRLEVQPLLIPEQVDLTPAELELVTEHAGALEQAGMRVEPFGGSTVIVMSKPVLAGRAPAATIVREVIDRLAAAAPEAGPGMLVEEVLHGLACRAAIKAGDPLSQEEVDALVRDRHAVQDAHHCPHGRPTSLVLSRQELDRQFRRV